MTVYKLKTMGGREMKIISVCICKLWVTNYLTFNNFRTLEKKLFPSLKLFHKVEGKNLDLG